MTDKVMGLPPKASTHFLRLLLEPLDQNPRLTRLDEKSMQMLHAGKMPEMTKNPQTSPELEAADAPGRSG